MSLVFSSDIPTITLSLFLAIYDTDGCIRERSVSIDEPATEAWMCKPVSFDSAVKKEPVIMLPSSVIEDFPSSVRFFCGFLRRRAARFFDSVSGTLFSNV